MATMRSVRLLLVVLAGVACGAAVAPTVANAHTDFDFSLPTDGASVGEPVSEITVAFTSPVSLVGDGFAVLDPRGNELAPFAVTDDDAVFRLQFDPPLAGGTVAVKYEVRAEDGHVLTGNFVFDIDAPVPTTATPTTPLPATTTTTEAPATPTTSTIATTSPSASSTTQPSAADDTLDAGPASDENVAASVAIVDDPGADGGGSGTGLAIAIAAVVALAAGGFALVRSRTSA